jgi:hypothetical protein
MDTVHEIRQEIGSTLAHGLGKVVIGLAPTAWPSAAVRQIPHGELVRIRVC